MCYTHRFGTLSLALEIKGVGLVSQLAQQGGKSLVAHLRAQQNFPN